MKLDKFNYSTEKINVLHTEIGEPKMHSQKAEGPLLSYHVLET